MRISDWSSDVCSSDLGETQRRSYPGVRGQYGTRGWELVRELDLVGNGARIAEEAQALLSAPQCPEAVTTLILGSEQMALQIHESVGHAIELDRILGWEAAFAGTSWLDRSEEHTSELQSLMRISYAVFCLKKKIKKNKKQLY